MALYEVVFITRQDLTAENVDNLTDKFSKIIAEQNGKVVGKEYWGLRNLAYPINKNSRGHYVMLKISDESKKAALELKRIMRYNEDVIDNDIFRVEKHSSEASKLMLSVDAKHYKAGQSAAPQSATDSIIDQIIINT